MQTIARDPQTLTSDGREQTLALAFSILGEHFSGSPYPQQLLGCTRIE